MRAKFLNQQYTRQSNGDGYLKSAIWSTVYVTDLPMETQTEKADKEIGAFIKRNFPKVEEYSIERNGMTRLWQFTMITQYEVMEWEIIEETDEERKARLKPIAEKWWNKAGYAEFGNSFHIDDITEKDNGNTLIITLLNDCAGTSVTLRRNDKGGWSWKRDDN